MLDSFNWLFVFLAFVGGFLPTIFWLWFWLQEDKRKPEPLRLIMKTFIIGGFFIVPAFLLEKLLAPDTDNQVVSTILSTWQNFPGWVAILSVSVPIIIWAFVEEVIKYMAAHVAALKNKACDEPIDLMIYLITAALGFAAIENFLFLLNILIIDGNFQGSFFITGNLRFLGATLLHVVSSAVLGASLAFAYSRSRRAKFAAWVIGLFLAGALHAVFNFFIIINDSGRIFGVLVLLWLMAVLVIFLFEAIKRLVSKNTKNY